MHPMLVVLYVFTDLFLIKYKINSEEDTTHTLNSFNISQEKNDIALGKYLMHRTWAK